MEKKVDDRYKQEKTGGTCDCKDGGSDQCSEEQRDRLESQADSTAEAPSHAVDLDAQVKELTAKVAGLTEQVDAAVEELARVGAQRDSWQSKATALFDQYARAKADFDGFRKRTERDLEGRVKREKSSFLKSLLEVMDNFERFLKAAEKGKARDDASLDAFHKGVVMIQKQLMDVLLREGVEAIESPVGKELNPEFHDAVAAQDGGGEHGTVIEELQTGYTYKGIVLRPTRVRVIR